MRAHVASVRPSSSVTAGALAVDRPPCVVQFSDCSGQGNHLMPKEQARESNVFQLNARVRKPIDKGFRESNETPKQVQHPLAERTKVEPSALDQLMTILAGRRGH